MKSDLYRKAVLTVIAICLVILAADKVWMPAAHAQAGASSVNLAYIGGVPVVVPTEASFAQKMGDKGMTLGTICWQDERKVTKPVLAPFAFSNGK